MSPIAGQLCGEIIGGPESVDCKSNTQITGEEWPYSKARGNTQRYRPLVRVNSQLPQSVLFCHDGVVELLS